MNALRQLTRTELRLVLREPVGIFFTLAFPCLLIGILGSIKGFRQPDADLGGLRLINLYVTITIALVLAMLALQFTPAVLATYREKGILRRMSTTPVHPAALLAAQLAASLLVAAVSTVLLLAVGRIVFAVPLPRAPLAFLVAYVLSAGALLSIGLLVAALAPNGKAGSAIGTVLFFPVMFFAGLYAPRESMAPWLQRVSDFTPLGAGEQALHDASVGHWPPWSGLAVLLAYLVILGGAAARAFRWE